MGVTATGCTNQMNDDFYIGWEDKAPATQARTMRRVVALILTATILAAVGLATSQRLIGVAYFEWGDVRPFTGVLHAAPYPHLVLRDDLTHAPSALMAAPLVAPLKFGVSPEDIAGFDGRSVTLRATRIYRDGQLMLELEPKSVRLIPGETAAVPGTARISLGQQTFRGEIVDSKCWLGVMNPGVLTPHRACAVRCISGGVPPMLLVRRQGAAPLNLLLVSPDDKPVNDGVLDLVAEPVEITGEVVRQGELVTLRADPANYRRLSN